MIHASTPILPRALLFDMDGTLTEPMLDFPRIKAEMGIGEQPILEALSRMNAPDRAVAERVLHRHEDHAATNSTLNAGCLELLDWARQRRLKTALVTRNTRRSADQVLQRHAMRFDALITRDDAPHKPRPEPLLLACDLLGIPPADAWMIGDGQYDVEAGLAAEMRTVWVSHGSARPFAAEPWQTVPDLPTLTALLRGCLPGERL